MARPPTLPAVGLSLGLSMACVGSSCREAPVQARLEETGEGPPSAQTDATRADLAALGYVSYVDDAPRESPEEASKRESGLIFSKPERVAPAYRLLTYIPEARAILVDAHGKLKHLWHDPDSKFWIRAELQPDGDLLVIGSVAGTASDDGDADGARRPAEDGMDLGAFDFEGRYLARYDWRGNLRWRRMHAVHHDLDVTPEGEILTLGFEKRRVQGVDINENTLLVYSAEGELLRSHSLYDLLTSGPELYSLPLDTDFDGDYFQDGRLDLLHVNSCEWISVPSLVGTGELYGASCVLVSVRHQSLVAIVDLERQRLAWAWGPGDVEFQHEATWLENGNVLLLDNGSQARGHSRVLEVDPRTDDIRWEFRSSPPESFFTKGRGTVHSLPGGNVLVASSNQGEVFEATREGDVVWRYVHRDRYGRRVVVRAECYPPELVEPLLAARGRR